MKIFVYGSLKRNYRLHYYLDNAKFISKAITCHKYPMILSNKKWYPYLINRKGKGYYIEGELYEINFNLLKRLDIIEGVPFYYIRKKICVISENRKLISFVYFYKKNIKFTKNKLLINF